MDTAVVKYQNGSPPRVAVLATSNESRENAPVMEGQTDTQRHRRWFDRAGVGSIHEYDVQVHMQLRDD